MITKTDTSSGQLSRNELIDRLLTETDTARKRGLLQMLRAQTYEKGDIRTDFLD